MFRRLLQLALVVFVVFLVLPAPSFAGSANDPEILSRPNTSAILRGDVIPHLEITKGWIQPQRESDRPDRFRFVLEVASLPPLEDIPKDAVYTFHYTVPEIGRLYWRANWSSDQTHFEFLGGIYAGCVPTVCPGFDDAGNRNYIYMSGSPEQRERVEGEVIPGAPGRIVWTYPMEAYTDQLHGLEMKGLFAATYTFTESRALRYADIALSLRDYMYRVSTPWHERLFAQIPGPSPLLVAGGLLGLLAVVGRRTGRGREADLDDVTYPPQATRPEHLDPLRGRSR